MKKTGEEILLQEAREKVSQCDRCGACLPVCPLFGVREVEAASARGKNALVRALTDGGLEPTADLLARVDFCLLCRACVETCPNKVGTDAAMIDVRQYLRDRMGCWSAKEAALAGLLKSRGLVKLTAAMLSLLRRFGLNDLLPRGLVPDEQTREHFLTAFAGPAALGQRVPSSAMATVAATARVAYFKGCGMRMLFPAASAETFRILQAATPVLRKDNPCCGLPHLAHGRRSAFLALARQNIALYENADVVVSDCASCSGTLKHISSYFAGDPLWQERAAAFSRKVLDLTEYLVNIGYRPRRQVDAPVTYHDPCHLARGQGITQPPRDLLEATGRFIEMKDAATCCGGAGAFHLEYPVISSRILEKKRANIERTGAAVVVTACPGCLIQLVKAAQASGGKFRAMHISQII